MKKVEILELNVMEDHIHMVATIPPKVSVSELMGILVTSHNTNPFVFGPGPPG